MPGKFGFTAALPNIQDFSNYARDLKALAEVLRDIETQTGQIVGAQRFVQQATEAMRRAQQEWYSDSQLLEGMM